MKKYLSEAVGELRHVQWPTKNYAIRISTIAAIFVLCSALLITGVDILLNKILLISN